MVAVPHTSSTELWAATSMVTASAVRALIRARMVAGSS
jgi:hypothetical protein